MLIDFFDICFNLDNNNYFSSAVTQNIKVAEINKTKQIIKA